MFMCCTVLRQSEFANGTDMLLLKHKDNHSELALSNDTSLELQEILCAPPVTNQTWQLASGYIGAVLMLVMAVYGRYSNSCPYMHVLHSESSKQNTVNMFLNHLHIQQQQQPFNGL